MPNVELTQNRVNSKLKGNLLNKDYPVGGSKANWFEKELGFYQTNSSQLSNQIKLDQSKVLGDFTTENSVTILISLLGSNNNEDIEEAIDSIRGMINLTALKHDEDRKYISVKMDKVKAEKSLLTN